MISRFVDEIVSVLPGLRAYPVYDYGLLMDYGLLTFLRVADVITKKVSCGATTYESGVLMEVVEGSGGADEQGKIETVERMCNVAFWCVQ